MNPADPFDRKIRRIAGLVFCLGLVLATRAQAADHHRIDVDGVERTYDVYAPPGIEADAPLVVVLHGRGSSGREEMAKGHWHATADKDRFIVAAPDALTSYDGVDPKRQLSFRQWLNSLYEAIADRNMARWRGGPNDMRLIRSMIDRIGAERKIDRSRIYVVGYSRGGFMAHKLALEMPERFAAVAVVAPDEEPEVTKPPERPVSFLLLTGDHDRYHPISGGRPAATMKRWQSLDRCPLLAAQPAEAADQTVEGAGPCADGTEIRYVIVHGVGHDWSSAPTSYSDISWKFISRFTRRPPDGG
jgi:polyhydroxybutyrate depolymerase